MAKLDVNSIKNTNDLYEELSQKKGSLVKGTLQEVPVWYRATLVDIIWSFVNN